jgi:starch synthase (maltosyl-transferring)
VVVVVNLDPHHTHESTLWLDLGAIGIPPDRNFAAHDELTGDTYVFSRPDPYVKLSPEAPAHILSLEVMAPYEFNGFGAPQ